MGGSNFDNVLIEKFANEFNAKGYLGKGGDVRTLPKAMTKLRKNAQKVTHLYTAPLLLGHTGLFTW